MLDLILSVGTVIGLFMTSWFLIAAVSKRNDVADIAWGLGFIVVAYYLYYITQNNSPQFLTILVLTSVWGARLASHIYKRFIKRKEDTRYTEMKKDWGSSYFVRTYLQVFLFQGFLMLLISASAIIASQGIADSLNWINIIGLIVWIIGFFFESIGDLQLSRFISDPKNKGRLMTSGLWRYTRHPNYFGEISQWWGIFLITVSLPFGLFAIISPITITFMILKVSGIPMLEKKYEGRKDFEEYKNKTSAFFPWIPKSA